MIDNKGISNEKILITETIEYNFTDFKANGLKVSLAYVIIFFNRGIAREIYLINI